MTNSIDSEVRAEILAALRTNCRRPRCKVKHRAKLEDSITKLTDLIAQEANKARLDEREKLKPYFRVEYKEGWCGWCGKTIYNANHDKCIRAQARKAQLTADKEQADG